MKKETPAPNIQTDKIALTNIVLLKCGVNSTDTYQMQPAPPEKIVMELGTIPTFDLENRKCRFRLHIKLEGQDNTGQNIGLNAEFLIDFFFTIDNLSDFIIQQKEGTQVHAILGSTLLGISFSTTRGIVLERTKGTPLAGFILPVINPSQALYDSSNNKVFLQVEKKSEPDTTERKKLPKMI